MGNINASDKASLISDAFKNYSAIRVTEGVKRLMEIDPKTMERIPPFIAHSPWCRNMEVDGLNVRAHFISVVVGETGSADLVGSTSITHFTNDPFIRSLTSTQFEPKNTFNMSVSPLKKGHGDSGILVLSLVDESWTPN